MKHTGFTCLENWASATPCTRRRFMGAAAAACLMPLGATLVGCESKRAGAEGEAAGSSDEKDARAVDALIEETLFVFDTVVTLSAYCADDLMQQAVDRCLYFESKFSRTLEGSDVCNVNDAAGGPVEVSAETAEVIRRALEYGENSGGLFDITIGAVSSLWDFKARIRPSDAAIAEAVSHVDYRNVLLDGNTVTLKDPFAKIDLGGIAKGYIADDLARLFAEGGCESGIINLGGNVLVMGSKPDGSNWRVGIQDPNAETNESVIAALSCSQTSVVTSGLYERTFTQSGQVYHHILDPRTGYPAQTDLVSSSIVTPSSTDGDACATWMFLLGCDGALDFLEQAADMEGLVVHAGGEVRMTSEARFELR